MTAKVSLTLIVKNEESSLPACLTSITGLADEILVIDTGSTDRTKEVAAGLGARVLDFPWIDDFAAARNEGLKHATGKWIFWLDADERLDDANREKLGALIAGLTDEKAAYVMKQRSAEAVGHHSDGVGATGHHRNGVPQAGSFTVVDQVRLFPNNPQVRWRYRVHEQILPALRQVGCDIRFTDIAIDHAGYVDPALRRRKTERNLRLLHLEDAERPDDPFTLFNLGWAYQELGRTAESLPLLIRSLERSQPSDSIVRKLYTLITAGYRHLGRPGEAMAACRAGRARCPDDAELLHFEATLRSEAGDLSGAEACLRQLTRLQPTSHFASLDEGLRGPGARHQLAQLYRQTGRLADAESEWQAVVAEQPQFTPAWLGLAEVYLQTARWPELDHAATQIGDLDGAVLRARGCLARKDFAAARQLLEETIARHPNAILPRVILSHVLLQENRDLTAAERVLRDLLERDPSLAESWRNLAILHRHQGRLTESLSACRSGRVHCPYDGELALFQAILLREIGDLTGAETSLLRILESPAPPVADAPGSPGKAAHHFATARHNLALVYREQARPAEAETQWRAVLAEQPDWAAAWLGLGELYLEQQRWPEMESILTRLEAGTPTTTDAAVLRARAHMARKEYASAKQVLETTIARVPLALPPRILLSHALLREGADWTAAEKSLRDVLAIAPDHVETTHNLALLLHQQNVPQS